MRFNYIIFSAGVLLLSFAAAFDVNYLNYEHPIRFSEMDRISFYDFRAYKKPGESMDGVNEFAFIKTRRELRHINDSTLELESWFYPSRSYVFNQELHSPGLLRHELYHFRITEYFTRLFRKEISESYSVSENRLAALTEKYAEQERDMQQSYDNDSYHSYVLQQQVKWENTADSLLQVLKRYDNPVVHFHSPE